MHGVNDINQVQRVIRFLEEHGIRTWLFGGWAEELHGIAPPRSHGDIDLLYLGEDFTEVDQLLGKQLVEEIRAKHLPHKRAFISDGVMTELLLVHHHLSTMFCGRTHYRWPADTFNHEIDGIRVASRAAVVEYRQWHTNLRKH